MMIDFTTTSGSSYAARRFLEQNSDATQLSSAEAFREVSQKRFLSNRLD
jgi:hypothetical protein